jgi:GcrA cell cycle regulator
MVTEWTDASVKVLEKLWAEGISAAGIAKHLGAGCTRNAVLGKAHRLALPPRFIASAKPRSCERVLETPPRAAREPAPRQKPKHIDEVDFREVDLMSLEHEHCRWPREKRGAPGGFVYCGQPRSDVSAYCSNHNIIAYQPCMPRRKNVN